MMPNPQPNQESQGRIDKTARLHNNFSGLDLKQNIKPARIISGAIQDNTATASKMPVYNEPRGAATAPKSLSAPSAPTPHGSPHIEETGSNIDPVKKEPGQILRSSGSETDPVKICPSQKMTGSENNPAMLVNNSQPSKGGTCEAGRKLPRLPQFLQSGALKPKDHFTAIPSCLFRDRSPFETPNDFMIYLRLFGVSYGFGRNTCDMGLTELVEYTGLCKNSVKKAIERLEKRGWIKMIGDFEPGQITRKWRVLSPWEKGFTPEPTFIVKENTGSNSDGVKNGPGQTVTQRGSKSDTATGAKNDPYINQKPNKYKNSSHSQIPENLRKYFDELRPQRKRESEQRAFEELQRDFVMTDIEAALVHVRRVGASGGEPCHSPMAYLASAMSEVLTVVRQEQEKEGKRMERAALLEAERRQEAEKEKLERQEWDRRELAFDKAFCGAGQQQEVIARLCRENKFFTTQGQAARSFAISSWWLSLNDSAQMEASA